MKMAHAFVHFFMNEFHSRASPVKCFSSFDVSQLLLLNGTELVYVSPSCYFIFFLWSVLWPEMKQSFADCHDARKKENELEQF